MSKQHVARVALNEGFWVIVVDGVGVTQARFDAEIELMARDLVAVSLDVAVESVAVAIVIVGSTEMLDGPRQPDGQSIRASADRVRGGWELGVDGFGVTYASDLVSAPQAVADQVATLRGQPVDVADIEVSLSTSSGGE